MVESMQLVVSVILCDLRVECFGQEEVWLEGCHLLHEHHPIVCEAHHAANVFLVGC